VHEGVARAHRGFDNAAVRIVDSRTIELIERTGEKVIERERASLPHMMAWQIKLRFHRVTQLNRMIPYDCTENDRNPVVSGREADNRAALTLPYPADPNRRLAASD